jgi:two-component system response regulator
MNADIILVEDNPGDAELTIRTLRKSGATNKITHLKNGAQLLDYLFGFNRESAGHLPSLILLDIKMPKVDGLEALARIRQEANTKMIPVIVFGSSEDHPDIGRALILGANSYIIKPLDLSGFLKALECLDQTWLSFSAVKI